MRYLKYLMLLVAGSWLVSCKKAIDLYPQSNLNTGTYYTNTEEVKIALTGCYNGLHRTMLYEWQLTELRTDNSKQGAPASTASTNRELSDLDMFIPNTAHPVIYNYWLATYNNIRNANIVLQRLGVKYNPSTATLTLEAISIPITETDRKQLAGEALFIRAYHYFNLVRLFGGVFLVHEPILAQEAKGMNRSSAADIYKLIEVDLGTAAEWMNNRTYSQILAADRGRATRWAAKGLLAKAYLTQNRKAEAITLLQDVRANSGHSLQSTYSQVFATDNEMNSEILFAVRYKAGGLGLGSPFANTFAPLGTGANVINGDGEGMNYPTAELDTAVIASDARRSLLIAVYGTGSAAKFYTRKFFSQVTLTGDAENDWPILRYADIILMLAEAQGYSAASVGLINQVRSRSLPALDPALINTVALFERALERERRIEFAFENQRFFDLVRFNTTMTTITAEQRIKDHFANEYATHYSRYLDPTPTLAQLQGYVTREKLLLPIPQREIDVNTQLRIEQNPGY